MCFPTRSCSKRKPSCPSSVIKILYSQLGIPATSCKKKGVKEREKTTTRDKEIESERLLGLGIERESEREGERDNKREGEREREREREVDTIGFSEHVACNVLLLVQTGGTVNQNPCQ